eukprot:7193138-Prymnesium_polylepis.1
MIEAADYHISPALERLAARVNSAGSQSWKQSTAGANPNHLWLSHVICSRNDSSCRWCPASLIDGLCSQARVFLPHSASQPPGTALCRTRYGMRRTNTHRLHAKRED